MHINRTKILVLGNGPMISDINFDRLDPSIETFGVNRIWLKHFPRYYFFNDIDILRELNANPVLKSDLASNSIVYTSDWLVHNHKNIKVPSWAKLYLRSNRRTFPDSVTTGLDILNRHILKDRIDMYTFYIAGVHLKWTDPSHFWKGMNYKSLNDKDAIWYNARFKLILQNFARLKDMGFRMVSVTPNSLLNKVMRYENINNLYV